MIMTPGSAGATIQDYGSYTKNCTLGQKPYRIPINSLADVQLFIRLGFSAPGAAEYGIIRTCGATACSIYTIYNPFSTPAIRGYGYTDCDGVPVETFIGGLSSAEICMQDGSFYTSTGVTAIRGDNCSNSEVIVPDNYIIAQDSNDNYYAVFKGFTGAVGLSCFIIAITLDDQIYFSEEYCITDSCNPLTLLKGCYGKLDNKLAYDCEGVYFGTGEGSIVGDSTLVYSHELLIRGAEVTLSAIKNSFKQGRTRSFRTEKEKIFQFWGEIVPEWYISEIDAIFYRGEVYIASVKYLVNETQFEKIEDCLKIWKPSVTLKESCLLSFSCDADPCDTTPVTECCDPDVVGATVETVELLGRGPEDNPGDSGEDSGDTGVGIGETAGTSIVIIACVIDQTPVVVGTSEPVTGLVNGSTVVTCDAFIGVYVEVVRGNVPIPSIDPMDGSNYFTKNIGDNFITFSNGLVTGEFVRIQTIIL